MLRPLINGKAQKSIAGIPIIVYQSNMTDDMYILGVPNLRLRILLCKWRVIDEWGPGDLNRPIWRFYWNATPGAHVVLGDAKHDLGPSHWMLIPPNTPAVGEQTAPFEHFFVHFTLGSDCRLRRPELFTGPVLAGYRVLLEELVAKAQGNVQTSPFDGVRVEQVLLHAMSCIRPDRWLPPVMDERVRRAIALIEGHLRQPLSNAELGRAVGLHPKSLVRLFRNEVGVPPQRYALRLRVDRASEQLLQDNVSVETAAETWGFSDRFHLTRAMARHRHTTPGQLRRQVF